MNRNRAAPSERFAAANFFRRAWARVPQGSRAWLELGLVWLLLNVTVNSRFPASTSIGSSLYPAWEITALIAGYAGWLAWRGALARGVHLTIVALLVSARLFRFVDGCYTHFFHREFKLAVDLPLLPEAVRLLLATDGIALTLVQLAGALLAVALLAWLLLEALLRAERALITLLRASHEQPAPPVSRASLGLCLLVGVGAVPLAEDASEPGIVSRLYTEAIFLRDYPALRRGLHARFHAVAVEREQSPHGLESLGGRDVSLILIESYGRGALETTTQRVPMQRAIERLRERLTQGGSQVASAWLAPPTYGGGSWFAHATLTTGIKVWSPLDYDLLLASRVAPLSGFMKRAGYHTLNVMPGTTRLWPQASFYGFDQTLYAKDFDYTGPWLSWGRFPDQYVLDHVRRCCATRRTLYKELKLVSSHVPWRAVPPLIDDWDSIETGDIYHRTATREYPMKWSHLEQAHEPYVASIIYDLDVVGDYVQRFEADDALVFILGDHQPVKEASRSDLWDVPIHVAGPPDLVTRFVERGHFTPGLLPARDARPLPMEDFLPLFLASLSKPSR